MIPFFKTVYLNQSNAVLFRLKKHFWKKIRQKQIQKNAENPEILGFFCNVVFFVSRGRYRMSYRKNKEGYNYFKCVEKLLQSKLIEILHFKVSFLLSFITAFGYSLVLTMLIEKHHFYSYKIILRPLDNNIHVFRSNKINFMFI